MQKLQFALQQRKVKFALLCTTIEYLKKQYLFMYRVTLIVIIICYCFAANMPLYAQQTDQPPVAPSTPPNNTQPPGKSTPEPGQSTVPPPMKDIYDIKPLEKAGLNPMLFVWVAVGIVIVALLIALAVFLWKRRKKKQAPSAPPVPPEKIALMALKKIDLLIEKDAKLFYFKITEILRAYLQARFGLDALEMTTEELLPKIAALELDKKLQNDLKALFYHSDPVKFAEQPADRQLMQNDFQFVEIFVNQTTPAVEQ
ncbi:hypothetical protein QUF90_22180 [Desulfococcaceae bacterium HSG9]|nr:hypothetical protein [Desulfococcaceae bacterium HSG9]